MKHLLQDGDRVFTIGGYLVYDKKRNTFVFDGFEDETYFEGEPVEWTQTQEPKPYIAQE